jgi:hypothetical protein
MLLAHSTPYASLLSSNVPATMNNLLQGGGCVPNAHNYGVRIGCGDVQNIKTPVGSYFTYYTCGYDALRQSANMTLATTPHDPSKVAISMRR